MRQDLSHVYGLSQSTLENLYSIGVTEVIINKVTAEMLMAGIPLTKKKEKFLELQAEIGDGFKLVVKDA